MRRCGSASGGMNHVAETGASRAGAVVTPRARLASVAMPCSRTRIAVKSEGGSAASLTEIACKCRFTAKRPSPPATSSDPGLERMDLSVYARLVKRLRRTKDQEPQTGFWTPTQWTIDPPHGKVPIPQGVFSFRPDVLWSSLSVAAYAFTLERQQPCLRFSSFTVCIPRGFPTKFRRFSRVEHLSYSPPATCRGEICR